MEDKAEHSGGNLQLTAREHATSAPRRRQGRRVYPVEVVSWRLARNNLYALLCSLVTPITRCTQRPWQGRRNSKIQCCVNNVATRCPLTQDFQSSTSLTEDYPKGEFVFCHLLFTRHCCRIYSRGGHTLQVASCPMCFIPPFRPFTLHLAVRLSLSLSLISLSALSCEPFVHVPQWQLVNRWC